MKKKVVVRDQRADGINKVREENAKGAKKIGERMIENLKKSEKSCKTPAKGKK